MAASVGTVRKQTQPALSAGHGIGTIQNSLSWRNADIVCGPRLRIRIPIKHSSNRISAYHLRLVERDF